jgi:alpha-mannosidase
MYAIDCVTPRRHMPLVVERVIRPAVAHPYESGLTDARAIEARRAAVELTDRYHTLGSEDILYEAIKPSEDARGVVVVRMVAGASPVTTGSIQLGTSTWLRQVDLLERPTEGGAASLNQHFCHVSLGPTQMLTAQMNTDPASARVTPKARKRGRPAK